MNTSAYPCGDVEVLDVSLDSDLHLIRRRSRDSDGPRGDGRENVMGADLEVTITVRVGCNKDTHKINIPKHMPTNLSFPLSWMRPFVGSKTAYVEPLIIHDWLYVAWQHEGKEPTEQNRKFADDVFLVALRTADANRFKRWAMYRSIRACGMKHFQNSIEEISDETPKKRDKYELLTGCKDDDKRSINGLIRPDWAFEMRKYSTAIAPLAVFLVGMVMWNLFANYPNGNDDSGGTYLVPSRIKTKGEAILGTYATAAAFMILLPIEVWVTVFAIRSVHNSNARVHHRQERTHRSWFYVVTITFAILVHVIMILLGYPFYRSSWYELGPWRSISLAAGRTTQDRSASSGHGSAATKTVWTTWSGCGGRPDSRARRASTEARGAWATVG